MKGYVIRYDWVVGWGMLALGNLYLLVLVAVVMSLVVWSLGRMGSDTWFISFQFI